MNDPAGYPPPTMSRLPYVMKRCPHSLWEGVDCDLPSGHKGPHHRAACAEGAALSWRSSATEMRNAGASSSVAAPRA
jgi:hypothetical protein